VIQRKYDVSLIFRKLIFIGNQDSIWKEPLQALQERFPEHEILLDPEASRAALPQLDALLGGRLDPAVFEQAVALKAVFSPITGVNHLPVERLLQRGITVHNIHGQAPGVAQCALAMTLAFYGRLVEYHNDLRETKWHGFWVGRGAEDEWHSLFGRPCAIFGTGAIGVALARMLKAFDCPVVGYRRRADAPLPPHFDRIETDLTKAVQAAEILYIALPLTPATEGLFTKELLLSAQGKFLVNVGRGPIVDEEGLYLALKNGVLKGAAIDTWYTYPQGGATTGAPSRFPIHELPNVILSPHVAGSNREAVPLRVGETVQNITEWLTTGRCARAADLRERY
jgi:phosphoglycerate dehydrogenase-like enzyme